MISHECLINGVRSKGFSFKTMGDRASIYRQKGSTRIINISRHTNHEVEYAKAVLRQAGMNLDEIERFISECIQH